MTNIEYYGLDNLKFETYSFGPRFVVEKIYYKAKHSKNDFVLRSDVVFNDDIAIRDFKVKWLLDEVYMDVEPIPNKEYKHAVGVKRRQYTWD